MARDDTELLRLVTQLGPVPDDVDLVDFYIASLPPADLTRAAKASTYSYETVAEMHRRNPELLKIIDETPSQKSLADEILVRQQRISAPRRWLATIAATAAIGGGFFALGYNLDYAAQHEVFGARPAATAQFKPGGQKEALEAGALIGGLAGLLAGVYTSFAASSMAGRLARRPAQRLVDRARKSRAEA